MTYVSFNGKIISGDEKLIHPDNRSFRYGEGLFETIRLHQNKMPLWEKHWNRLCKSLPQLFFELPKYFSSDVLQKEVLRLVAKNKCAHSARVRITIFKGEGGLWEQPSTSFNYLIQCWSLEKTEFEMNVNGLDLGVFEAGKKACDAFSHLKSNNYLLYALAAQYGKRQKWNEAVVLNQYERICDTTIANIFFINNETIYTPNITEGCVEGVMRAHLIENFIKAGLKITEGAYNISNLLQADEIFLTNAFYGIRWVKTLGGKQYPCNRSAQFFEKFVQSLF